MRTLTILTALLALLAGAPPVRATGSVPLAAPVCAPRPGELVRTIVPALPAGVREFELVLLREDGRAVQVGPELPAGVAEVEWRMPRAWGRTARLALRAGSPEHERVVAISPAFAFAPPAADEAFRLATRGGDDAVPFGAAAGAREPGLASGPGSPGFFAGIGLPAAGEAPPAPAVVAPALAVGFVRSEPAPAPAARPALGTCAPARVPLRL